MRYNISMIKIIAIGGGEIGRPGYPIETLAIDKEIIRLANKDKPNLLFIGTASGDDRSYLQVIKNYYGKQLGCIVNELNLSAQPKEDDIKLAIDKTDIIYVGGGNTLKMMIKWRKFGLDKIIKNAANNKVLAGVSAGAICWFNYGLSDSRSFINKDKNLQYIKVHGRAI